MRFELKRMHIPQLFARGFRLELDQNGMRLLDLRTSERINDLNNDQIWPCGEAQPLLGKFQRFLVCYKNGIAITAAVSILKNSTFSEV